MRIPTLLLAACAALTLEPVPAAGTPPATAVPVDAARLSHISVVKLGSGSPVVLIPGLSSPRDVWSAVAPQLAKGHSVYLVQVNGFAGDEAGGNSGEGVLDGIVEDLHATIQREHGGRAKVVGHSMGGLVGLMLASKYPQDVSGLMIVDALPFAGVMLDPNATVATVRPVAAMLKARMAAGYSGPSGDAAAEATAKSLAAKAGSAATVKSWILRADPKVAAEAMAEDLVTDMRPALATMEAPVTVLHPAEALGKDQATTAAFYKGQYAGTRTIEFIAVPDSGHFIMLDQPQKFLELVQAFAG
jgi:pimeloyl-ACP methyl ester carboxylesterase